VTEFVDPAILTPKLLAFPPDAIPPSEIVALFVAVVTKPVLPMLIPCEAELLGPPVPISVIPPPVALEVWIVHPFKRSPWLAPVVPVADAVIAIVLPEPEVEKFKFALNPLPLLP
jgi:hypothetical protein